MLPLPETLRIARVLNRVWAARPPIGPDTTRTWSDLDEILAEAKQADRRIRLATRHRLTGITPSLKDELNRTLERLARQAERLADECRIARTPVPDLRAWIEEVRQLDAEFGSMTVRWPDQVLRVVTEPITLEGVELGPFAIEFGWDPSRRFRGARSFEVIALEPNPAAGREEVVHPHVEGRRLCAGEATEPLRQAVDDGRLAEAFLLVQSVLAAYNPRSPYVSLAEWDGFRCSNCGRRGTSQSGYTCEGCDSSLCSDCNDSCARCSETRCSDCLDPCDVCGDRFCRGCLDRTPSERMVCTDCRVDCPVCGARVAKDEITDDRCSACAESSEPEPLEIADAS